MSSAAQPGCVGGLFVGKRLSTSTSRLDFPRAAARLVVVGDFDFVGITILPPGADAIPIVDTNALLTGSIAF